MEKKPGSGRLAREMRRYRRNELLILLLIILVLAAFFLFLYLGKFRKVWNPDDSSIVTTSSVSEYEKWEKEHVQEVLAEAERIAAGYDFDGAIEYLKNDELYADTLSMLEKADEIEKRKVDMKVWPKVREITHIAVRPLIADTTKAFSAGAGADNYNREYITVAELEAILQELYERGYVLVSLHDISSFKEVTIDDEGHKELRLKDGKIYLPEGKTPIVLSEENICYSPELSANGFASKLVIKKDGSIEAELDDGRVGAYDLVPVLENFIRQHPDFSYRGARAVLGVSGSDGLFGYRTSYLYKDNDDYEEQLQEAKKVAEKLKNLGYELGMNGYHYVNMGYGEMEDDTFRLECNNWLEEVTPIIGDTDIFIYPNGNDIGDWRYYSGDRYEFLKSQGFVYFINMNANERAWNQILNYYMRQGRRMITGKLLAKEMNGAENFTDLFDITDVYDVAHLPIK